jgi:putative transposase
MDKFDNLYRIESARYKNWDYGSNAFYFVTICTGGREHFFGDIINSKMVLNEIGKIVETEWLKTPVLRPDMNLKLGEFVVMPNHFHAIIYIGKNMYNTIYCKDAMHRVSTSNDAMHRVSAITDTMNNTAATNDAINHVSINKNKPNKFGPQSKNLSSILRGFKSSVTVESRKINPNFSWQSRFHDRIIRDKDEWYAKTNYIKNNPKNWVDDEFHNDEF